MGLLGIAAVLTRASIVKISNLTVIKFACSLRGVCACFENGVQLLYNGIPSEWFTSKACELNCLIFAFIVYHITVCSCTACETRVIVCMLYFEKTSDITRQNNTSTTSKMLKSKKQWNSFKTIKDILLIIPSKNNGILRIIEAKFGGGNAKESATLGRIRKIAQVSKINLLVLINVITRKC